MSQVIRDFVEEADLRGLLIGFVDDLATANVRVGDKTVSIYPCVRDRGVMIKKGFGRGSRTRLENPTLHILWLEVFGTGL